MIYAKEITNGQELANEFKDYGRGDQFSREAFEALFQLLDECYDDAGSYKLDVIGLCCDFMEYDSMEELQGNYDHIESLEDLHDNTLALELPSGGLVIQQF